MRTGLFGGAFNPIHHGHLKVARAAITEATLDRLIFIPTGNTPHKEETSVSRSHRFNMIHISIPYIYYLTVPLA